MNITITARKTSVRDSFKDRIDKKLAKLDRFFDESANAIVTVTNEGDRELVRNRRRHMAISMSSGSNALPCVPWTSMRQSCK